MFAWNDECQEAMDQIKITLTSAPILIKLDFTLSALPIILNADASTTVGWGPALCSHRCRQMDVRRLKPTRFESGIWCSGELKCNALKLECRGLLKALKKLQFWLFGRYFQVETDSQTLCWLLNQPPNDLPNAMMTRWLTYIGYSTSHPIIFLATKMERQTHFPDEGMIRTMGKRTMMSTSSSMRNSMQFGMVR